MNTLSNVVWRLNKFLGYHLMISGMKREKSIIRFMSWSLNKI